MTPVPEGDPRDRNFAVAFDVVRVYAAERAMDPKPLLYRVAFAALTESGGRVYANAGEAFTEDTPWSQGLTAEKRAQIAEVLRGSLDYPHDAVGKNGGSTGWLQQLSREYVKAALGASWGWGTIAETMDVATSTRMFLSALKVTGDPVYVTADGPRVTLTSSIAADVLRVQRPLLSEVQSGNYSADQVARAKRLVDNWTGTNFEDGG